MSNDFIQLTVLCVAAFFVQGLAALPWLSVLTGRPARKHVATLGIVTAVGLGFALFLNMNNDAQVLARWGRIYMAVLHLQLGADAFVLVFRTLLTVWSKGGAVALASFQEGVRQPMFWLLTGLGCLMMLISVFIPYFTFGEDLKMVKELCYAFTMLAPAVFGVIAACMSVTEEIEGRTAVTLLSKPILRRDFLLGKFAGITLASLFMTLLMGWFLVWMVLYKMWYDANLPTNQDLGDPAWVLEQAGRWFGTTSAAEFARGALLWVHDAGAALPGLVIGFGQVIVLIAVAVALGTRVPMVVNLTMCLLVYLLGHLTPIMTEVTRDQNPLLSFVAQLFETVLPGLDLFDVGSSIIRELPLDPVGYSVYTLNVALYALTYTAIALLLGLILFEDRDVA